MLSCSHSGARRLLLAAAVVAILAGCSDVPDVTFGEPRILESGGDPGAAPVVAASPAGRIAVAWITAPDGGSDGRLVVRVADEEPVTLVDPLGPVAPHGESPPKLVWGADGSMHALYVVSRTIPGRRFPASALRHTSSPDGGRSWTEPAAVTDGDEFGSHNFHALHVAQDGTLYAAWLDGRGGQSATYVAHSTDNGASWSANVRVSEQESCPCCRTGLATAPDGTLYVAWRGVLEGGIRDMVISRSSDHGLTWSEPVRIHADNWQVDVCPHAGPALQVDSTGRLHAIWWTGKEGSAGVWYAHSDDGARTFSDALPLGVARFSRPAHVQLVLAGGSGGRGVVSDDDEGEWGDGVAGASAGRVIAVWDDGTTTIPRVVMRISGDAGRTFGDLQSISDEAVAATFPVVAVSGARISVLWAQQSAAEHSHAEGSRPSMQEAGAVMGLPEVGANRVVLVEGSLP